MKRKRYPARERKIAIARALAELERMNDAHGYMKAYPAKTVVCDLLRRLGAWEVADEYMNFPIEHMEFRFPDGRTPEVL